MPVDLIFVLNHFKLCICDTQTYISAIKSLKTTRPLNLSLSLFSYFVPQDPPAVSSRSHSHLLSIISTIIIINIIIIWFPRLSSPCHILGAPCDLISLSCVSCADSSVRPSVELNVCLSSADTADTDHRPSGRRGTFR